MRTYWLVISVLAVWRVTHLLTAEDGPWDIIVRIRKKIGNGFWGRLLDCFYCLSLWAAAPFAYLVGESIRERFTLWLALSAGAILLERGTSKEVGPPPYFEDGGQDNAVLRTGEDPTPSDNIRAQD
ncbi:MAG TPA: DUF1360 domain-containing protein [Candidatus Solibacter sp.]|nr:DUF1360 domain-containing protein [Candidatus Solibacter sp.]